MGCGLPAGRQGWKWKARKAQSGEDGKLERPQDGKRTTLRCGLVTNSPNHRFIEKQNDDSPQKSYKNKS